MTKPSISDTNAIGMPLLGFGTFLSSPEDAYESTSEALKLGYRHIDTAEAYQNEEGVGKALKESGLDRTSYFVTTKLWPGYEEWGQPEKDYDATIKAFKESLSKLGLDFVDLYLIHAPLSKTRRVDQYKAILELQKEGLIKHVGVSNYGAKHLQEIHDAGFAMPAANQLEIHPLSRQSETLQYMDQHNILPIAYSSLAPLSTWRIDNGQGGQLSQTKKEKNQNTIHNMAQKLNVSDAQLLLRWGLQHDYCILPKSKDSVRVKENMELYNFEISDDDLKVLDSMDANMALAWNAWGSEYGKPDFNPVQDME